MDLAVGHGKNRWDLNPQLAEKVNSYYRDAKVSLRSEFTPEFIKSIPNALPIATTSKNREEYIAHPETGEKLNPEAVKKLGLLRESWQGKPPNVQIVISDGLNAKAIMDEGHLLPYLEEVRRLIREDGGAVEEKNIVVTNGRVRAGYEIGELLFGDPKSKKMKAILHIIGERPGTMHHTYSVYITSPKGKKWARKTVDHDITRVVSGIADTALPPREAAADTVNILKEITGKSAPGSRQGVNDLSRLIDIPGQGDRIEGTRPMPVPLPVRTARGAGVTRAAGCRGRSPGPGGNAVHLPALLFAVPPVKRTAGKTTACLAGIRRRPGRCFILPGR